MFRTKPSAKMNLGCKTTLPLVFLFSWLSTIAQEADTTRISSNTIPQNGLDSIALDNTSIASQMEGVISKGTDGKFQLNDLEEARKSDSLWLKELSKSADWFTEMYTEVQSLDEEKTIEINLPTDTLKARLAKLNEKTPFNIAYNPSLESVIKSFLVRKKDLMERMLTASQFYFPLFEQELDNQDVPLEMKYLAIVESALNPRARSRVGAKGLLAIYV